MIDQITINVERFGVSKSGTLYAIFTPADGSAPMVARYLHQGWTISAGRVNHDTDAALTEAYQRQDLASAWDKSYRTPQS